MSHGIDDSPARDALQEHLDAPLSIRKKRSWMHTLREAVQKGALTAKAAVDNFRGEPIVSTKKVQASEEKDEAPTKHATTNSRMPRTATMSLRRHISRHNTYNSIVSTPDRIGGARGPESISDPGGMESPQENCHRKRNSVTSSIAGSLRGLRRRTSRIVDAASPTQLPAQYPLPSSPVPIPVPVLERLSLHFEPADFMSSDLGTELRARDEHEKHLGSPGVPTRNKWSSAEAMRSLSNVAKAPTLGLLDVPRDSFDFGFFDRSPSPMPGTNLTLEIDGAHDQGLHLFERSVMAKASRPQLRPMRSLDAMAEACAVAHEMEDNAATPKVGSPAAGRPCSDSQARCKDTRLHTPNESRSSSDQTITTATTCPPDMEELSRQPGQQFTQSADDDAREIPSVAVRGTFSFDAVASSGPPSPTKTVVLPFRCKDMASCNEPDSLLSAEFFGALADSATKSVRTVLEVSSTELLSESLKSTRAAQNRGEGHETPRRHDSTTSKGSLYPWPASTPALPPNQSTSKRHLGECYDEHNFTDYDEFKTRQLFGYNDADDFPSEYDGIEYDHGEFTVARITEPVHGQALVTQLYQSIPSPQLSSPISRTTDIGEVFWNFPSDPWLKECPSPPRSVEVKQIYEPALSASADKAFSKQEEAPAIEATHAEQLERSDGSGGFHRGMGDRLAFDLQRSTRNMRYNALHQPQKIGAQGPQSADESSRQQLDTDPLMFGNERLLSSDDEESSFATLQSLTPSLQAAYSTASELLFEQPESETDNPDHNNPELGISESSHQVDDSSVMMDVPKVERTVSSIEPSV